MRSSRQDESTSFRRCILRLAVSLALAGTWLAGLLASPAAFADDGLLTPPNDTCAGVIPVTLNVPVTGSLDASTNNDYQLATGAACFTGVGQSVVTAAGRDVVYSFTAPATGSYSFHLLSTGGLGNPVVYIAGSCPIGTPPVTVSTCIAAANRNFFSTGAEEVMCQTLTSGQTVFVFVDDTSSASTSTFRLEITPCVRESEPNDSPASANALACPSEGSINPGSDVDFFSFAPTRAGDRLFALADGFAANSADFDMRITTNTDTLEFDELNADGIFGSTSPAIAGTKATGSSTFVRLNHHTGSASEPYRLYTVQEPSIDQATTETEPNNSIATANAVGSLYAYGAISTSDDDYYSVCAETGDIIVAALDCDPGYDSSPINGWLTLSNAAGAQLVNVDDAQATSPGRAPVLGDLASTAPQAPAEGLAYQVASTGLYYVRVRSNTTAPLADYLLAVGLNCQAPIADVVLSAPATVGPIEAGNVATYSIVVTNDGPTTAQSATLHIGNVATLSFAALNVAGPAGWSCTTPPVGGAGPIDCTNPCLPRSATSGASLFQLSLKSSCGAVGAFPIPVNASSITPDGNTANNSGAMVTNVVACDDGNACTTDSCSQASGCQHVANRDPCNDGDPCTTADTCSNGACSGTPAPPAAEINDSLRLRAPSGNVLLNWQDPAGPYNVYRGIRGPGGAWSYNQVCLQPNVPVPPIPESAVPGAGSSFYYLVSRKGICGESVIGRNSSGVPDPNTSPCQ